MIRCFLEFLVVFIMVLEAVLLGTFFCSRMQASLRRFALFLGGSLTNQRQ